VELATDNGVNVKISGIYSIIHLASGRAYFGSSARALSRMKEHRRLLCNGNHPNIHLQRAWNLYGAKAFRFAVEEIVKDVTQLLIREQAWIDAAQSLDLVALTCALLQDLR